MELITLISFLFNRMVRSKVQPVDEEKVVTYKSSVVSFFLIIAFKSLLLCWLAAHRQKLEINEYSKCWKEIND